MKTEPDYPYMTIKTSNGFKTVAKYEGDTFKACGVCPDETRQRARKGLLEVRMARALANMGVYILPTDGLDKTQE